MGEGDDPPPQDGQHVRAPSLPPLNSSGSFPLNEIFAVEPPILTLLCGLRAQIQQDEGALPVAERLQRLPGGGRGYE